MPEAGKPNSPDAFLQKGQITRPLSFGLKVEQLADFALLMFQQGKIRQISGLSAILSVPRCLCGLVLLPMPGFVFRGAILTERWGDRNIIFFTYAPSGHNGFFGNTFIRGLKHPGYITMSLRDGKAYKTRAGAIAFGNGIVCHFLNPTDSGIEKFL